jgi:hypothetical protein
VNTHAGQIGAVREVFGQDRCAPGFAGGGDQQRLPVGGVSSDCLGERNTYRRRGGGRAWENLQPVDGLRRRIGRRNNAPPGGGRATDAIVEAKSRPIICSVMAQSDARGTT